MDFTPDSIELLAGSFIGESLSSNSAPGAVIDCSLIVQELTTWEKWVIRKAQEDEDKREQDRLIRQRERKAAKTERKVQHEKRRKCEKVYEEWLTDKASKQAASAQRESSALKEKLKEIEKKKHVVEDKAKTCYEEWCAKKKKERLVNEKLKFEEQKRQAQVEQEKKERSSKAYRDWMRVNYNRRVETDCCYNRFKGKRIT